MEGASPRGPTAADGAAGPVPRPAALIDVAGRLEDGDFDLGTYTDEELLAVTQEVPEAERLIGLSTLADLGENERATAARSALRSLVARGLVAPPLGSDRPVGSGLAELEVYGELALVLDMLSRPSAVAMADRELHEEVRQRVWYGIERTAVLDHEPTPGGLHRFTLRRPERAAEALAAFLDPCGWATTDGELLVHDLRKEPPPGWAAVDRATEAPLTGRVFSTSHTAGGPEEREALLAGSPSEVWLLSVVADAEGAVFVRAVTVSPASLAGVAAALISGGEPR